MNVEALKRTFTRDLGPLPVWAWLVVVVVGVVIGRAITRATRVEDGDEIADGSPSVILPSGYGTGAVGGTVTLPNGAAPEATATSQGPATNDEWRAGAVTYLIGAGWNALGADRALYAYLNGQALTADQQDAISAAITALGVPPMPPSAPTAESAQPATPGDTNGDVQMSAPVAAPPKHRPKDRAEAVVIEAFDDILGREPDPQGLAYWSNQIRTGADTVTSMRAKMQDSKEYGSAISGAA